MTVITNLTRGTVLAGRAETARSRWARFIGLMGRSQLPLGGGLVLPNTQGVHTHFMRFPIDLVFYDREGTVLDVFESVRPWRCSPYRWRAKGIIELPAGTVRAAGIGRGDRLTFSEAARVDDKPVVL